MLPVIWYGKKLPPPHSLKKWCRHLFYFSFIGLAYLILEIGLMNFYQVHTGSPAYCFAFILGTLLPASGLDSRFAAIFGKHRVLWGFGGILLFPGYHLCFGRSVIAFFSAGPLTNSMLIAATVFPLRFFMGMPFPMGLETAKKHLGEKNSPVPVCHQLHFFRLCCGLKLLFKHLLWL